MKAGRMVVTVEEGTRVDRLEQREQTRTKKGHFYCIEPTNRDQ